jgi:hypothetical protein
MSTQRPVRTNDASLVMKAPPPDRPALHANLLNVMQKAGTALTPLFPYMYPGAIVPAGAVIMGGPGKDYGQFFHHNSVDEVIIAFVAHEALLETGQVYSGGRVHGVNSFLKDQARPSSFALFSITQRQLEEGSQPEAVVLLCKGCRQEIFRCEWESRPPPGAMELQHPFPSIVVPFRELRVYNQDPELRKCRSCGHQNEPFPTAAWGWDLYAAQSEAMARASEALLAAGGDVRRSLPRAAGG